jgi:hypothetical protein
MEALLKNIPEIPESKLDSSVQTKLNSSGGGNPKVFIPTLSTDFTSPDAGNANKIWEIQTDIDLVGGSFVAPANITLFLKGGNVLNVGNFIGNKTAFRFINEDAKFDLKGATVTGTFKGDIFYFSNFGGIDDNSSSTDNKTTFKQALNLVNSLSGTLVVNKVNTGVYWMSSTNQEDNSPFFPNINATLPYIGLGNDGVTMEINGDVEIKEKADDIQEKTMFQFYNTSNSKIINRGIITGDRDIHDYVTRYKVTAAPTSGTYIDFKILVINPKKDNNVIETIDINIPITANTSLAAFQTEILTYINTNASFADYTAEVDATTTNYFKVHGQAGVYFRLVVDEGDTNLTFATINDSNQPHENGTTITWGSRADYCDVIGGTLRNATGEGVRATYQGNGGAWIQNFTRGDLNFNTGVFTPSGSGDYMIMDDHRDFSGYTHPWFYVGYNAFGAVTSLYPTFWVMWEEADNSFIEMSPLLEMHRRIPIETAHKKGRLVLDYTPNSQYMFMDAKSMPLGGTCKGVNFVYNRRQHVSNPPPDMWFTECTFDKVGGFSPNFDIDWEDLGKYSTDGGVEKCTFRDAAAGSLIMKGNEGTKIINNIWEARTNNIYSSGAISTAWGRKILITGNTFTRRDVTVDINVLVSGSHMTDAVLTLGAGGGRVSSNDFTDVIVRDSLDSSAPATSSSGGPTTPIISNQTFKYTKSWVDQAPTLLREYGTIGYEDVTFKFNDKSSMHYSTGITFPLVVLSNSSIGSNMHAQKTITNQEACQGYHKNTKVLDIAPSSSGLHNVSVQLYAHQKIDGFDCSTNVQIARGYIVDGRRYKNINVRAGWLRLELYQFASTNTGTFPTIYLDKPRVSVPVEIAPTNGYLNNTVNGGNEWTTVFRTPLKDVNIVVEDGYFESLGNVVGYFLKAEQYGTLTFKNTEFVSKASGIETIDLTATNRVPATTGAITFIDCEFTNINLVFRVGDKRLFTKAHKDLEVHADNTTALAGGVLAGYMYRTATGDNKVAY